MLETGKFFCFEALNPYSKQPSPDLFVYRSNLTVFCSALFMGCTGKLIEVPGWYWTGNMFIWCIEKCWNVCKGPLKLQRKFYGMIYSSPQKKKKKMLQRKLLQVLIIYVTVHFPWMKVFFPLYRRRHYIIILLKAYNVLFLNFTIWSVFERDLLGLGNRKSRKERGRGVALNTTKHQRMKSIYGGWWSQLMQREKSCVFQVCIPSLDTSWTN